MQSFIDDLYYGRINPYEKKVVPEAQYVKGLEVICQNEKSVLEKLSEEDRKLFEDMLKACDELSATSDAENFKLGFKLGVRMMMECFNSEEKELPQDV